MSLLLATPLEIFVVIAIRFFVFFYQLAHVMPLANPQQTLILDSYIGSAMDFKSEVQAKKDKTHEVPIKFTPDPYPGIGGAANSTPLPKPYQPHAPQHGEGTLVM